MSITDVPTDYTTVENVVEIPVDAIRPAPDNPRGTLGDLTGLIATITIAGVRQPITVTPRPEDGEPPYMIVMGHRRHAAAKEAGLTVIPAIIKELSEDERIADMHIENMNRDDLKPTEEARSIKTLRAVCKSEREVASRIGRSQAYVNKRLSLLGLPADVQTELDAGRMTVENGQELARLKDDKIITVIVRRCKRPSADGKTHHYDGIGTAVTSYLEGLRREKEVRQVERALRADGVTVVDFPVNRMWTSTTMRRLGSGFNEVDVEVAKHTRRACHAAAVNPNTAEVVYVCTDPAKHQPKPGAARTDKPATRARIEGSDDASPEAIAAERAAAEEEAWHEYHQREAERVRAELDAAAEARRSFIGDFVRGRCDKNKVLTLILTDYVDSFSYGSGDAALSFVGITVEDGRDPYDAFEEYARQSLANLTRAALALRLDELEGHMPEAMSDFNAPEIRRHYAFLIANGYDPTAIEAQGLAEAEAREAERAAARAAAEAAADTDDDDETEGSETDAAELDAAEPVVDGAPVDAVAEGNAA